MAESEREWPADHAWATSNDTDLDSTLVGGSRALVDELLADDRLEVLPWPVDGSLWSDADDVNLVGVRDSAVLEVLEVEEARCPACVTCRTFSRIAVRGAQRSHPGSFPYSTSKGVVRAKAPSSRR